MRRLPTRAALLALALLVASATAAAYHGVDGSAGLVVAGPISLDGRAVARAAPGAAAFEGPSDVAFLVEGGVARVTLVEHRLRDDAASRLLGRERATTERAFEMPAPRVDLLSRDFAFDALLFSAGLSAVRLDAPTGATLAREEAGATLAPSAEARSSGLDPARLGPGAFSRATNEAGVRAEAPRGRVVADGEVTLFLYGATVRFAAGGASETARLGAWDEGSERVVRYALVALSGARVEAPYSEGRVSLHAPVLDLDLDGTASLPAARGSATVGDRAPVSRGGDVRLGGILTGSAWPTWGDSGALRFEAQGDVTLLAVGAETTSFLRTPEAAATASLLVLALAALAWFWPALKASCVVPLYARVNGSAVMDHAGRERAFAVVRERPGASVNDVAAALGVSWSTAAYHLQVLEREGFVGAERRGRHRRYFAAGGGASRDAVFAAEHATARRLLAEIAARPGVSQKELAAVAGVSASTASWHLERLRAAGFVASAREWRTVRYAPGPRFADLALDALGP